MRLTTVLLATVLSTSVHAKPAPEAVKEVVDYYFNGQQAGIVLADLKLCDDVHADGPLKNECKDERAASDLFQGQPVMVWMLFMVPSEVEPQDVMLQLNHQGVTLGLEKAKVASSMRYRVWRKISFDRPGEWQAKIIHDNGQGLEVLRDLTLRVQDKPAN